MAPVFLQIERNDASRRTGVKLFALVLARCHDLRGCHDARVVLEMLGDERRSARREFLINFGLLSDLVGRWVRRWSVFVVTGWSSELCEGTA
jgi:hypothetical protein